MQLMKQAHRLALAALGAAGLAVAAAGPALASCAGAPEQGKVTMLADWLIWAQQGPMISASINGLYEEAGLEVEIVAPANPVDNVKMAAARNVAFAMVDQIEFLLAREQGIPVKSIGAMIRDNTAGLVFLGDAPIAGPADLKGKTIGVNPRPDLDAQVDLILKGGGLTRADVKIVDPGYGAVELLARRFARVVLLTPAAENARFVNLMSRMGVERRLALLGIDVRRLTEPVARTGGRVTCRHVITGAETTIEDVALLTYATPRAARGELAEELAESGVPVTLIGDCLLPRDAASAIHDGHRAALAL